MADMHPIVESLLEGDIDDDTLVTLLTEEADAKPYVLALLRDRNLWWPDAPGGGKAPLRALFLVGALHWQDAIPDVLDALSESDPDDEVYSAAIEALTELGAGAASDVLDAARRSDSARFRKACAEVLAAVDPPVELRPRIRRFLERLLSDDPELAAGYLVDLEDPQALTALHKALQHAPDPSVLAAATTVRELAWAIRELGGTLTAEETAKAFRAEAWLGARRKKLL